MRRPLLHGLAIALIGLPALSNAQHFAAQDDWYGAYQCGNRNQFATLKIAEVDDGTRIGLRASFAFGGDNVSPMSSYRLAGDYDSTTRALALVPRGFFSLPAGYQPVGFTATLLDNGVVLTGRINQAQCGAITLIRGRTDAPPPRPLPAREPASPLPVAMVPMLERFVYLDPGVNAALGFPCGERARVLDKLLNDRRADPTRQAEALVALAGMEAKGDCRQPRSYATQQFNESQAPAVRSAKRVQLSEAAYRDGQRVLSDRREWLALWPTKAIASHKGPDACSGSLEIAADEAAARQLTQNFEGTPLWQLFLAVGQHALGDAAMCTQPFPDGQTQMLRANWPRLIAEWRKLADLKLEGPLQSSEIPMLRGTFEAMSRELINARNAQADAMKRAADTAEVERRRIADEKARPTGDRR